MLSRYTAYTNEECKIAVLLRAQGISDDGFVIVDELSRRYSSIPTSERSGDVYLDLLAHWSDSVIDYDEIFASFEKALMRWKQNRAVGFADDESARDFVEATRSSFDKIKIAGLIDSASSSFVGMETYMFYIRQFKRQTLNRAAEQ